MADSLKRYREKRDFSITPEPVARGEKIKGRLAFVIQKHWARRLHYDFCIELNGTMKSWAVPKGPSFDPQIKRMAMHVEDHPISYNTFEGDIPMRLDRGNAPWNDKSFMNQALTSAMRALGFRHQES